MPTPFFNLNRGGQCDRGGFFSTYFFVERNFLTKVLRQEVFLRPLNKGTW